jgi:hypothetical protein
MREPHLRFPKLCVVGSDGQIAHHGQFASSAQNVALDRSDDRLVQSPWRPSEIKAAMQHGVPPLGSGCPAIGIAIRRSGDIEADAKTAAFSAQHHDRRRRVPSSANECFDDLILHHAVDRIELRRTIECDDADVLDRLISNEVFIHFHIPSSFMAG